MGINFAEEVDPDVGSRRVIGLAHNILLIKLLEVEAESDSEFALFSELHPAVFKTQCSKVDPS